jgi:hypothetical protein
MDYRIKCVVALSALLLAGIAPACGGEDEHEEEESFSSYNECFEHVSVEASTTNAAMQRCDEMFSVMHTDLAGCMEYYPMNASEVPMEAFEAWCMNLFP